MILSSSSFTSNLLSIAYENLLPSALLEKNFQFGRKEEFLSRLLGT